MAVVIEVDSVLFPLASCLFERLHLRVDLENHILQSIFDLLVSALQTLVRFQSLRHF
jgi:hypothetical protein